MLAADEGASFDCFGFSAFSLLSSDEAPQRLLEKTEGEDEPKRLEPAAAPVLSEELPNVNDPEPVLGKEKADFAPPDEEPRSGTLAAFSPNENAFAVLPLLALLAGGEDVD